MNYRPGMAESLKRLRPSLSWAVACLFVLAGCGKNEQAELQKPFALPGASKVIEALDKKDYEATVAGLFAVKNSLTEKDKPEYRRLRERVLEKLVPEMGESEPAKEAYRAIAVMETGR